MVLTSLRRLTRCSALLFHACPSKIKGEDCNVLLASLCVIVEISLFWPPAGDEHASNLVLPDEFDNARSDLECLREFVPLSDLLWCTLNGLGFETKPGLRGSPLLDERISLCECKKSGTLFACTRGSGNRLSSTEKSSSSEIFLTTGCVLLLMFCDTGRIGARLSIGSKDSKP
jgi:hypothetical protein